MFLLFILSFIHFTVIYAPRHIGQVQSVRLEIQVIVCLNTQVLQKWCPHRSTILSVSPIVSIHIGHDSDLIAFSRFSDNSTRGRFGLGGTGWGNPCPNIACCLSCNSMRSRLARSRCSIIIRPRAIASLSLCTSSLF